MHGADKKKHKLKDKETFWTECSKDDIKFSWSTSLRADPMLKLSSGCPLPFAGIHEHPRQSWGGKRCSSWVPISSLEVQ
jgi:hypothetical protein